MAFNTFGRSSCKIPQLFLSEYLMNSWEFVQNARKFLNLNAMTLEIFPDELQRAEVPVFKSER